MESKYNYYFAELSNDIHLEFDSFIWSVYEYH